jgi:hypothetical protein
MTRSIVIEHVSPPIPTRDHDYCARFSFHDGDDPLYGEGKSERDAVFDLLTKATEIDDDGTSIEEVVNMAFDSWKGSTADLILLQGLRTENERLRMFIKASSTSALAAIGEDT